MRAIKWCIVFMALLSVSATAAIAGTAIISYVFVDAVDVVPLPLPPLAHKPGTMEVTIQGGFTLPAGSGMTCDTHTVSTLPTVDPDRSMLKLLLFAVTNRQRISMGITDDPQYQAYPNRCSLMYVELEKP